MKNLLLLFFVFGAALADRDPHIVDGGVALPAQHPYMVSLRMKAKHFCGGSIISEQWVISAAFCTLKLQKECTVLAGTNLQKKGGKEYKIETWITHEDFSVDVHHYMKNNLGVIKVVGSFKFTQNLQPIKIDYIEDYEEGVVPGWGVTNDNVIPNELQYTVIKTIDLPHCRLHQFDVTKEQVCSFNVQGEGICSGDVGGPLVSTKGYLVGIISYKNVPCLSPHPTVFTRPIAFICWISQQTNASTLDLLI